MAGEALRCLRHELAAEDDADVVVVEGGNLAGGAAEGPRAATVLPRHVAPQRAVGHLAEPPGRLRGGEEDVVAGVGVGHPGHANDGEELHLIAVEVDDPRLALHRRRQLEGADGPPHDAPALRHHHVPVGVDAGANPQLGTEQRRELRVPGGIDEDVVRARGEIGEHRLRRLRSVPELETEAGGDEKRGVVQIGLGVVKERDCKRGGGVELVDPDARAIAAAVEIGPAPAHPLEDAHRLLHRRAGHDRLRRERRCRGTSRRGSVGGRLRRDQRRRRGRVARIARLAGERGGGPVARLGRGGRELRALGSVGIPLGRRRGEILHRHDPVELRRGGRGERHRLPIRDQRPRPERADQRHSQAPHGETDIQAHGSIPCRAGKC